jgi:hypothetical protein
MSSYHEVCEQYHGIAVLIVKLHMCSHMAYADCYQSVAATLAQELSTHISATTDAIHF